MTSPMYIFFCIGSLVILSIAAETTHYALVFPSQRGHPLNSSNTVYINGNNGTTVTIKSPLYNVSYTKTLDGKGLAIKVLNYSSNDLTETKNSAVLLDADNDVTVHVITDHSSVHGSYLAYPVMESANYFLIPPGPENCSISIAAFYNHTNVEIAFYNLNGTARDHFECIQLNKFAVYHSSNCNELTIGFIEVMSSQPVSVFTGKLCIPSCGDNWEQIPPVSTWGKHFFTTFAKREDEKDVFRVMAAFDGTNVTHSFHNFSLRKGEYIEIVNDDYFDDLHVTASSPILLYQTSYGNIEYHELFMIVPPVEQYSASFSVWFHESDKKSNRIEIITKTVERQFLKIDDNWKLQRSKVRWLDIIDTSYSLGTLALRGRLHKFWTENLDQLFMIIQYSDTGSGIYGMASGTANKIITNLDLNRMSPNCAEHITILTTPRSPFETTTMPNGTAHPDVTLEPETNVTEPETNLTGASIRTSSDKVYTVWIVIAVVVILCLIIVIIAVFVVIKMKSKRRELDKKVLFEKEENGSSVKIFESTVEHPYEPVCAKLQSAPLTKS